MKGKMTNSKNRKGTIILIVILIFLFMVLASSAVLVAMGYVNINISTSQSLEGSWVCAHDRTEDILSILNELTENKVDAHTYLPVANFTLYDCFSFTKEGKYTRFTNQTEVRSMCDQISAVLDDMLHSYAGLKYSYADSTAAKEACFERDYGYTIQAFSDKTVDTIQEAFSDMETGVYKLENGKLYLAKNTMLYDDNSAMPFEFTSKVSFKVKTIYNDEMEYSRVADS